MTARLTKTHACAIALLGGVLLGGGRALAQSEEDKLVKDMYGQKIAAARATPSEDDDVALANEMLLVAADGGSSDKLRAALAKAALGVAMPLRSEPGVQQAKRAVEVLDSVAPLPPEERATVVRELATRQLNLSRGRKPEEVSASAQALVEAHVSYAKVFMSDLTKTQDVDIALNSARTLVASYKLSDLKEAVDAATETHNLAKVRRTRLMAAEARLKAAQDSGDAGSIHVASQALAQVYVECDGDLVAAAKCLTAIEEHKEKLIAVAAAFLGDPNKLDRTTCLDTVEALARLATPLGPSARARIGDCAMRMAQAFLEGNPAELPAAKARLLIIQCQTLTGQAPAEQTRRKLEAFSRGLRGKAEILGGGRIRVSYDFSDETQFKDWDSATPDAWTVQKGAVVRKPGEGRGSFIYSKLFFKADKPLKVSFVGRAERELVASMAVLANFRHTPVHINTFCLRRTGATMDLFGTSWTNDRIQIGANQPWRYEILVDGRSQGSWAINGNIVREQTFKLRGPDGLSDTCCQVRLWGISAPNGVLAFGNVVIEGEVIVPDASAPASAPAAIPVRPLPMPVRPAPTTTPESPVM